MTFAGGADTLPELIQVYEDFVQMCHKAGITLKPSKVQIGLEQVQFYGYNIGHGTIEPADRNMDPVRNMTYPTTTSELRSVMGIFNQFSNFIRKYSEPAKILNDGLKTNTKFTCTPEMEQALDTIKHAIIHGKLKLHAPDYHYPLILETDGSDDGWGAVLLQNIKGERRTIRMWSKQWPGNFGTKPPYHREAKAWMNGMEKAMPIVKASPHALLTYTDHSPLTWIKHTSGKGPVSQFVLDTMSEVDYKMHYIKGEENTIADALSRFPTLGPRQLQRTGMKPAIDGLLANLLGTTLDPTKLWFDAQKDTKYFADDLLTWRDAQLKLLQKDGTVRTSFYRDRASPHSVNKLPYTFAIIAPTADKITDICKLALHKGTPFACLIPGCLVDQVARKRDGTTDTTTLDLLKQAKHLTMFSAELTWLVWGVEGIEHTVLAGNTTDLEQELKLIQVSIGDTGIIPLPPPIKNKQQWIKLQATASAKYDATQLYTRADGMTYYSPDTHTQLNIVPEPLREQLALWQHQQLCHAGPRKVLNYLSRTYHWPGMSQDIFKWVTACAPCQLLKAHRHLAHKHYRAKLTTTPRTAYGADYFSVKENSAGYNNILGIIDLATGTLVLKAVQGHTAANTAHTILYEIVLRKGCPMVFHSDAAKEFLSTAMRSLCNTIGCKQTSTKAHNPMGNSKMERTWAFVLSCLRQMTKQQYENFQLYLPVIAWVWNNTPSTTTNITPFEAEHGMKPRSITDSILATEPTLTKDIDPEDLSAIATSARAFQTTINNVNQLTKAETAAKKLNAAGRSTIRYKLGDKVSFFKPPSEGEARRANRNPKHLLPFCGPATITKSLSINNTTFEIEYQGRLYERSVINLHPYKSTKDPNIYQLHVDTSVEVNTMVAVKDTTKCEHYHIGEITNITDDTATVWYWGTEGKNPSTTTWTALYQLTNGHVTRQPPKSLLRKQLRYCGQFELGKSAADKLILLSHLGLNTVHHDRKVINAKSLKYLRTRKVQHHRMFDTWITNKITKPKRHKRKRTKSS